MTLDWRFDNEGDLYLATWYRYNITGTLMTKFGSDPANPKAGITNVHHIANGAIKITGLSLQDGGQYSCSIVYTLGSSIGNIPPDSVSVTVLGM